MPIHFPDYDDDILFLPLGGSNEIGMNLNLYRYKGQWVMIDLGIGFANEYLPGVDIIVPDISFLQEIFQKEPLLGLVLTHAHEDHLGAVPYLWEDLECPIYATPFTASVLKNKMAAAGFSNSVPINEVEIGAHTSLGPFDLEMIPLTHSIPEMQAIAIRTDKGVIMHTGDWKIDADPLVGQANDDTLLRKYGDEGILAIVCDSTNVFVEGESGSEAEVRKHLVELISKCEHRVYASCFASNIARVESIIRAAEEAGRHVAIIGTAFKRIIGAAQENGYLNDFKPFIEEKEIMDHPRDQMLVLCTGCQGEPMAALSKIARGDHRSVKIQPGDTVIFSSRVIPGNESKVGFSINRLVELGAEVETDDDHFIHVSGHPARAELEQMYQMLKPQICIPVHGEVRHIHEHAKLARSLQVPEAVEARNGAVILIAKGEAQEIGIVESGYIAIDGTSLIPTDSPIIRTRRKLRDDGVIFVVVVFDKKGELASDPVISAPGCLDPVEDGDLNEVMVEAVARAATTERKGKGNQREQAIRSAIRKICKQEIGKKPVIEIKIISLS